MTYYCEECQNTVNFKHDCSGWMNAIKDNAKIQIEENPSESSR